MSFNHVLIQALHIERMRRDDLPLEEHSGHAIFQTSTFDALLHGRYEGDVTVGELLERGDFGLGTFDHWV